MFERREYTEADRLDLAGFALLAFGLLVALSVFGYDAARSSDILGPPGAWVAGQLGDTLGVAVYALLAAWFVLCVLLFLRHSWLIWSARLLGWVVLVPAVAVLAHLLGHERVGGPPTGPGGTVGARVPAGGHDPDDRGRRPGRGQRDAAGHAAGRHHAAAEPGRQGRGPEQRPVPRQPRRRLDRHRLSSPGGKPVQVR
jgi:hypothetical protein